MSCIPSAPLLASAAPSHTIVEALSADSGDERAGPLVNWPCRGRGFRVGRQPCSCGRRRRSLHRQVAAGAGQRPAAAHHRARPGPRALWQLGSQQRRGAGSSSGSRSGGGSSSVRGCAGGGWRVSRGSWRAWPQGATGQSIPGRAVQVREGPGGAGLAGAMVCRATLGLLGAARCAGFQVPTASAEDEGSAHNGRDGLLLLGLPLAAQCLCPANCPEGARLAHCCSGVWLLEEEPDEGEEREGAEGEAGDEEGGAGAAAASAVSAWVADLVGG